MYSHGPVDKFHPHYLANAASVIAVGLVDLRLQYRSTYAGPDVRAVPAPVTGSADQLIVGIAVPGQAGRPPQTPAPAPARATATPFKPAGEGASGEEMEADGTISEDKRYFRFQYTRCCAVRRRRPLAIRRYSLCEFEQ